jgi:hypothetical protein
MQHLYNPPRRDNRDVLKSYRLPVLAEHVLRSASKLRRYCATPLDRERMIAVGLVADALGSIPWRSSILLTTGGRLCIIGTFGGAGGKCESAGD